jgi:hypothetical protein
LSSPFSAPPPRRSISYSNVSVQGSSHHGCAAGSASSGAEQRGALPTSSPFFSDQQGYSTVMTTPFSIWQPGLDGGAPGSSSAAAGLLLEHRCTSAAAPQDVKVALMSPFFLRFFMTTACSCALSERTGIMASGCQTLCASQPGGEPGLGLADTDLL